MRVFVHKSAFWVLLKGQNTKILRFFLRFWSPKDTLFSVNFFFTLCEKKLKNHGYKNAKEKSIFIFWAEKCVLGAHRWSKHQFFFVFGIFGHPRTHYRGDFFCLRFVFAKIEKKKL